MANDLCSITEGKIIIKTTEAGRYKIIKRGCKQIIWHNILPPHIAVILDKELELNRRTIEFQNSYEIGSFGTECHYYFFPNKNSLPKSMKKCEVEVEK